MNELKTKQKNKNKLFSYFSFNETNLMKLLEFGMKNKFETEGANDNKLE